MYPKQQNFLILGISRSGRSAAEFLLKRGVKTCFVYEELQSPKISQARTDLVKAGAVNVLSQDIENVLEKTDVVVVSPGVPINHAVAVRAKKLGKRVIGELELGFLHITSPIIAVTGTNGKTTAVTLIDEILHNAGINSYAVGNIGVPITSKADELNSDAVAVVEVSSFQLETVAEFRPHIACILNISPDHLERHYGMENYIYLKKRILKNLRQSEYAVLNFDDETVKTFYTESSAKLVWISLSQSVDGAYVNDNEIYFRGEYIMNVSELSLKGAHNAQNCLMAVAVAKLMGVETEIIKQTLTNFKGVKHRVEFLEIKNGVAFYNDSKATNTASTVSAVGTMNAPTVLILGGSEKGENYENLFKYIKESAVTHAVLTGDSRYNMLAAANKSGFFNVTVTENFEVAFKVAVMMAEKGSNVLLSPACASFDMFANYEERGEKFRALVNELEEQIQTV